MSGAIMRHGDRSGTFVDEDPRSVTERVMARAAASDWVLTTGELRALGASRDWIALRVRQGWLTPLQRGVYLVGRKTPTVREEFRAALLSQGDGAALTGWSTAVQFGLERAERVRDVWVAVPTRRRSSQGVKSVCRHLRDHELTFRRGLPTATIAAMLGEIARTASVPTIERLIHEAEIKKLLRIAAVHRYVDEHPRCDGVGRLRDAAAAHRTLNGSVGSGLEGRFHEFAAWASLPPSEHNVPFGDRASLASVDVLFREQWLAVEIDGGPHRSSRHFHSDRERDRILEADHGLPVLRVTELDLTRERRTRLARQLWAALARRDATLTIPASFG